MATFILGGIWHGAGWTFVFWGFLHGIALVIHRAWSILGFKLWTWLAWLITFNFINIAWVFFRAKGWSNALKVLGSMFSLNNVVLASSLSDTLSFLSDYNLHFGDYTGSLPDAKDSIFWLVCGLIVILLFKNSMELMSKFRTSIYYLVFILISFVVSIGEMNEFSEFLYFNFKQKLEAKSFSILFLLLSVLILVSSLVLNILDFSINDNDVIRKYQLAKIYNKNFTTVSTIIIGDFSGGNAINSNYFSKLIGQKSVSLCLTGSWGLSGSLGMLKKALRKNNNIKNVIIIQTLDIWDRPYSKESILELFLSSEIRKYISINALISYYFNPKEVLWHIEYFFKWLTGKNTEKKIDLENDYILQGKETYANGLSIMNPESTLNKERISTAKEEELKMLQDFCHETH